MVYVIQEPTGRNILSATKYGEIKFLIENSYQVTFSSGQVVQDLKSKLSNFCDEDYLLLMGDPVAIGIAVAIASHWNQGKVKMLKWDRIESLYYPVSIDIHQKNKEKDENF